MTAEHYHWRLLYADSRVLDEPDSNGSILERWLKPVELQVTRKAMNGDLNPIVRVGLVRDGVFYDPIFYRQRSVDVTFGQTQATAAGISGRPRTDVVVFGYGRVTQKSIMASRTPDTAEVAARFEGKLFAIDPSGNIGNAPRWAIAEGAIMHLLGVENSPER